MYVLHQAAQGVMQGITRMGHHAVHVQVLNTVLRVLILHQLHVQVLKLGVIHVPVVLVLNVMLIII